MRTYSVWIMNAGGAQLICQTPKFAVAWKIFCAAGQYRDQITALDVREKGQPTRMFDEQGVEK